MRRFTRAAALLRTAVAALPAWAPIALRAAVLSATVALAAPLALVAQPVVTPRARAEWPQPGAHPFEHPPALHYRAVDPRTDSTLWRFSVDLPRFGGAWADVGWRSESGDAHRETYRVAPDGGTFLWSVSFPERGTEYEGVREGDSLRVVGTIDGRPVERTIALDADPLYVNVALGLAAALRADASEARFWTFRPNEADVIRMGVRFGAPDTITVGGARLEAIPAEWGPKGWRGIFFGRTYWLRPSDGALLRTDESGGRVTELVEIEGSGGR